MFQTPLECILVQKLEKTVALDMIIVTFYDMYDMTRYLTEIFYYQ